MKESLQSALFFILWAVFWLVATIAGAALQVWLIDMALLSTLDPPWIITVGSSVIGFFGGAFLSAVVMGFFRQPQQ
jgi:hypothetical protein